MKISLNWLKQYIPDFKFESIESLTEKMVSVGLDIESVEVEGKIFDKFIIGEVTETSKHPNADKLTLCKVNTGEKTLNIVCGAPNVATGQKVCVALEGAVIPGGGFEIKKSKIRGEVSEGMICSEKELNMSESHEGILTLDNAAKVGTKFSEYINADDIIFEIGITPNRGDLFSHIGVAREVAAIYDKKISLPEINFTESSVKTLELIKISIENNEFCKRFTGRVISNVKIQESPDWLKKKIKAIGLRPRNNIVDITNFVMYETGQPLHAFDYDKIREKEIIVKLANEGDKFVTLDSKQRVLNSDSLMVCDGRGYSGIAGIMGGEYSEITGDTVNVFLESAYFDSVSVRKNSKMLGLQTDASQRFERGVDINMVEYASLRAAQLINEIAGGEISEGLLDIYPEKFDPVKVSLRLNKSNELIGIDLTEDEVIKLLDKIEIKFLEKENDNLIFIIPEFRRLDLTREVDLIEEAARLYGYDNIKGETNFRISVSDKISDENTSVRLIKEISKHFIGRGFNQIMTNPLVDEKKLRVFAESGIKLLNSVSSEMNSLRTNLIYGMLEVMRNNLNNSGREISLKLFEIGRIFVNSDSGFVEENCLTIGLSGKSDMPVIYGGDRKFDIFDIKGEAELFLSKLNLENYGLFYYNDIKFNGVRIDIRLNDVLIGNINKVDTRIKNEFGIENDVLIAEFYIDRLNKLRKNEKFFNQFSKFPSVKRDIALIIDRNVSYDKLMQEIIQSGKPILKNAELFDMYIDEKLGADKKGLAFSLEFSSKEKTLTDDETNKAMEKIINSIEKNFGAKLRS